jgi:hypothetical protein
MEKRRSKWKGRCAPIFQAYGSGLFPGRPPMPYIFQGQYPFKYLVDRINTDICNRIRTFYAARPRPGWGYSIKLPS